MNGTGPSYFCYGNKGPVFGKLSFQCCFFFFWVSTFIFSFKKYKYIEICNIIKVGHIKYPNYDMPPNSKLGTLLRHSFNIMIGMPNQWAKRKKDTCIRK